MFVRVFIGARLLESRLLSQLPLSFQRFCKKSDMSKRTNAPSSDLQEELSI